MQTKDIPDKQVLEYLAQRQGQWSHLWSEDLMVVMSGAPFKVALSKMRSLHKKGFVGGCTCGCRGDFEITDLGLKFIGQERSRTYTGY